MGDVKVLTVMVSMTNVPEPCGLVHMTVEHSTYGVTRLVHITDGLNVSRMIIRLVNSNAVTRGPYWCTVMGITRMKS